MQMNTSNQRRSPSTQDRNSSTVELDQQQLKSILDGNDPQLLVQKAEEIAKATLTTSNRREKKLSTSQIRNIFGSVKILDMTQERDDTLTKLILLKPKLAYAAGRHDEVPGLKILKNILSNAIDLVAEDKARFSLFCSFFEAILAYHKAEGGN